jgi:hypothetical protein
VRGNHTRRTAMKMRINTLVVDTFEKTTMNHNGVKGNIPIAMITKRKHD